MTVGDRPVAVGVNTAENNYYVVNQGSNNVTVIDGDTLRTNRPDPRGEQSGCCGCESTYEQDLCRQSERQQRERNRWGIRERHRHGWLLGDMPYALDLNLLTNKIYVANQNDATVTVIDGTGDTVSATVPTGLLPSGVAVNPVTNQVYVSNRGSGNVTVITVGAQQPVPLNIALTPVVSGNDSFTSGGVFSTFNETPSFNVTVTSAYTSSPPYTGIGTTTNPPPTQVYFSADGATPWSLATPTSASGANPATFTITLSPLGFWTAYSVCLCRLRERGGAQYQWERHRKLTRDEQPSESASARSAERDDDGSCFGRSQWSTGGHEDYVYRDRHREWQSGYRGSGSVLGRR